MGKTEREALKYTPSCVQEIATGEWLLTQGAHLMLGNSSEGWDGVGGMFKMEGTYVYPRLIHADVWQKPTHQCKAIILQLKTNKEIKKCKSLLLRE